MRKKWLQLTLVGIQLTGVGTPSPFVHSGFKSVSPSDFQKTALQLPTRLPRMWATLKLYLSFSSFRQERRRQQDHLLRTHIGRTILKPLLPIYRRKYDMRGLTQGAGAIMLPEVAYTTGVAVALELHKRVTNRRPVFLLTGDHRFSTPELQNAFQEGLLAYGVDVFYSDEFISTPVNGVVARLLHVDGSCEISASHNPWMGDEAQNGFKLNMIDSTDEQLRLLRESDLHNTLLNAFELDKHPLPPLDQRGNLTKRSDLLAIYEDFMHERINMLIAELELDPADLEKLVIVADTGHGVMGPIARKIVESFGVPFFGICEDIRIGPDGELSHPADPEQETHYANHLRIETEKIIRANNLEDKLVIPLVLDADGDRLGTGSENGGRYYTSREQGYLFIQFARHNSPDAHVVIDTLAGVEVVSIAGENATMSAPGAGRFRGEMRRRHSAIGYEFSRHVLLPVFDDLDMDPIDEGLYAGLFFALHTLRLHKKGRTLQMLLDQASWHPTLDQQLRPDVTEQHDGERYELLAHIGKQLKEKLSHLAGIDAIAEYRPEHEPDSIRLMLTAVGDAAEKFVGWILLRASNTEAKLSLMAQAADIPMLEHIKETLRSILSSHPAIDMESILSLLEPTTPWDVLTTAA